MTPIHVVGIGLDGVSGLSSSVRQVVEQATYLVGSKRHLSYFPDHPGDRQVMEDLTEAMAWIKQTCLNQDTVPMPCQEATPSQNSPTIAILVSGDPLFFGLGRLLLTEFSPTQLTFHPHVSSIQLAFSRIKQPWQDAEIISAHGRSLAQLIPVLQQGVKKIAILTDGSSTPAAIAQLVLSLNLPGRYQCWVCENLAGEQERIIQTDDLASLLHQTFAPLNVVVLLRCDTAEPLDLATLPVIGIPDSAFLSFSDRPGLMTKREVRLLVLGELSLPPQSSQPIIWDIGAGTGSVSIEIARLCPTAQVYAIEKTAVGTALIEQNCHRFQVRNVASIHGSAPEALQPLPAPDRIFIGGSGGNLLDILDAGVARLQPQGLLVLALTTLEHFNSLWNWLKHSPTRCQWQTQVLQVQLARSLPISSLTRFSPLNPVTLVRICPNLIVSDD